MYFAKKLCFVTLLSLVALWQAGYAQNVKVGVRAGYELIDQTLNKDVLNSSEHLGYHVGLAVDAGFGMTPFGVNLGVLYTHRDYTLNNSSYQKGKTYSIEAPLNLTYRIGLGDVASVMLSAGPFVRFPLSSSEIRLVELEETYKAQSFQAGANFGFGLNLGRNLYVGATYFTDLTDNYKNTSPDFNKVFSVRPNRLAITGCIYF